MKKILIVDDEVALRNFYYDILSRENYQVLSASRGDHAMDLAVSEQPDLVLLDLVMPGEKNLSLLKKMRAKCPALPIIIFSGYITPEIETQAFEAGAVEVLCKGIDVEHLVERLKKIVETKDRILKDKKDKPKPSRILLVDDEVGIRKFLKDFFELKGYKTLEAKNGEEAVKMVRDEKPSVILLDVQMPGMDGILTLKKIREIDPEVGVVMATSVNDEEVAREAARLGSYSYVLKPFDLKYLELVVTTRLLMASS